MKNKVITEYYFNGQIKYQGWYENGELHRNGDKPASIRYYENGQIKYKGWHKNGKSYRNGDKPAYIKYYKNGQIEYQESYKNGVLEGLQEYWKKTDGE